MLRQVSYSLGRGLIRRPHANALPRVRAAVSIQNVWTQMRSMTAAMVSLNCKTLVEMQLQSCEINAVRPAFGVRLGDEYTWYSYSQFGDLVSRFRSVLASKGVSKDDKVAVISNNRLEWAVGAYATYSLGAQFVPMYEAQLEKDWRFILNDSNAKVLLVSKETIHDKVKGLSTHLPNLRDIICFDAPADREHSYTHVMTSHTHTQVVEPFMPVADDVATIIYTSGTTGSPKGVELTHKNIMSDIIGLQNVFPDDMLNSEVRAMSFLPWAHVFGQTCELHLLLTNGSSIGIVPDPSKILESFQHVKPTILLSVPLLFKRVYDTVHARIKDSSPLRQRLFNHALHLARKRNDLLNQGKRVPVGLAIQYALFDRIVLKRIREVFGGELKFAVAGGAATPLDVLRFMEDVDIPLLEGYGLTETAPIITVNSIERHRRRLGTVGVPIGGVDVKILDPETLTEMPHGEDGEICCHGPNVMKGYRNLPEENDKVFINIDGKRYFRTGDRGRIVEDKFLKVTGRIKEQFKLENGKYVAPAPLEALLGKSMYISQTFVGVANRDYTIALIVPEAQHTAQWCAKNGIISDPSQFDARTHLKDPRVVEHFRQQVEPAFRLMKRYERPQKWTLLDEPFGLANQTLTAKLSLRRHNIVTHYRDIIEGLYSNTEGYSLSQETANARPVEEAA